MVEIAGMHSHAGAWERETCGTFGERALQKHVPAPLRGRQVGINIDVGPVPRTGRSLMQPVCLIKLKEIRKSYFRLQCREAA